MAQNQTIEIYKLRKAGDKSTNLTVLEYDETVDQELLLQVLQKYQDATICL